MSNSARSHRLGCNRGQALFEIVLIIPLFILVIFGFIFLARQERRIFLEWNLVTAAATSALLHPREERRTGRWEVLSETEAGLHDLANKILNFQGRTMPGDRSVVEVRQLSTAADLCADEVPSGILSMLKHGQRVIAKTCAGQSGFDAPFDDVASPVLPLLQHRWKRTLDSEPGRTHPLFLGSTARQQAEDAVYVPPQEHHFERRSRASVDAYRRFVQPDLLFRSRYASLRNPPFSNQPDIGRSFVESCLMLYTLKDCGSHWAPELQGPSLLARTIESRAAQSRRTQQAACLLEANARGMAMNVALLAGQEFAACPFTAAAAEAAAQAQALRVRLLLMARIAAVSLVLQCLESTSDCANASPR